MREMRLSGSMSGAGNRAMPNRTEACPAKAALRNATGRLPLLRLFSTPLKSSSILPMSYSWSCPTPTAGLS
jgi:hypothetical protein